jgi:hypothetical protein
MDVQITDPIQALGQEIENANSTMYASIDAQAELSLHSAVANSLAPYFSGQADAYLNDASSRSESIEPARKQAVQTALQNAGILPPAPENPPMDTELVEILWLLASADRSWSALAAGGSEYIVYSAAPSSDDHPTLRSHFSDRSQTSWRRFMTSAFLDGLDENVPVTYAEFMFFAWHDQSQEEDATPFILKLLL